MASFPDLESFEKGFEKVASSLPIYQREPNSEPANVMNVALRVFEPEEEMTEKAWAEKVTSLINVQKPTLNRHGVRRVTVLICNKGQYPWYYTLREGRDGKWAEELAPSVSYARRRMASGT